jgi:hypothetical protein
VPLAALMPPPFAFTMPSRWHISHESFVSII